MSSISGHFDKESVKDGGVQAVEGSCFFTSMGKSALVLRKRSLIVETLL